MSKIPNALSKAWATARVFQADVSGPHKGLILYHIKVGPSLISALRYPSGKVEVVDQPNIPDVCIDYVMDAINRYEEAQTIGANMILDDVDAAFDFDDEPVAQPKPHVVKVTKSKPIKLGPQSQMTLEQADKLAKVRAKSSKAQSNGDDFMALFDKLETAVNTVVQKAKSNMVQPAQLRLVPPVTRKAPIVNLAQRKVNKVQADIEAGAEALKKAEDNRLARANAERERLLTGLGLTVPQIIEREAQGHCLMRYFVRFKAMTFYVSIGPNPTVYKIPNGLALDSHERATLLDCVIAQFEDDWPTAKCKTGEGIIPGPNKGKPWTTKKQTALADLERIVSQQGVVWAVETLAQICHTMADTESANPEANPTLVQGWRQWATRLLNTRS